MKKLVLLFFMLGFIGLQAQNTFEAKKRGNNSVISKPNMSLFNFPEIDSVKRKSLNLASKTSKQLKVGFSPALLGGDYKHTKVVKGKEGIPVFMVSEARSQTVKMAARQSAEQVCATYLNDISAALKIKDPSNEFTAIATQKDDVGQTHIKMQQIYKGVKVWGSEVVLHLNKQNQVSVFNGNSRPTPNIENTNPTFLAAKAIDKALGDLGTDLNQVRASEAKWHGKADLEPKSELIIYTKKDSNEPKLTWHLTVFENSMERWEYFVDAKNGEVIDKYNHTCFFHEPLNGSLKSADGITPNLLSDNSTLLAPPETANAQDLNGVNQRINTYSENGRHYMIDISKPMFNVAQSNLPDGGVGAIVTLDFDNQPVDTQSPKYYHVNSDTGNWNNPTAISAHYNASVAYEYFRTTFNRNSINGQGGTITSIINIADEDGGGFENAFWNGQFMAYGNGRDAFDPFAGALDVGGHEMSHGVIENTANLVYQEESGAINESFADIFGTMIDREDWLLAEDIARTQYFPSGAMRSMQDPHNGGSGPGDNGWQPRHTSEQYFGSEDNGGVHRNSGIANYAYYLFATNASLGKDKAEQVYYRALSTYLTASSKFVDLRLAVIQSATDLHGENSPEVLAAQQAFDAVGIGEGAPTPTEDPIPQPTGDDFILSYDLNPDDANTLYISDTQATAYTPVTTTRISKKPSVADDGSLAIYVTEDQTINGVELSGDFLETVVSEEPIWGNVAISKDGTKVATFFNDQTSRIVILDLVTQTNREFELYNPTTADGVTTGDVLYPDALEWDYTGEYLMYDALNRLENPNGQDFEYWDVGFIRVWDNQTNTYGDGNIQKLFSNLPEGTSIGNPTFSKNSGNIVAFDLLDEANDIYEVIAANIETGDLKTVWENVKLGFPNYSKLDDKILFDARNSNDDSEAIAVIEMASDKITPSSNATILIPNAKWGIWYTVGQRDTNPNPDSNPNDVDGDGVENDQDQCPNTPPNTTVDTNGCEIFSLPSDNFRVLSKGESCAASNNGGITIDALQNLNYAATLSGNGQNRSADFTSTTSFNDLEGGTYQVCITVQGQVGYQNCFDVTVVEPQPLSVGLKADISGKSVTFDLTGGDLYTIHLNDEVFTTSEAKITLELKTASTKVTVKTDKECQGVFEETITLSGKIIVYPNPVLSGEITVALENPSENKMTVQLNTLDGKMVVQKMVEENTQSVKLNADNLPPGIYILSVENGSETTTYKIIKQ